MRSLLRAGLALGLVAAACKDSVAPADFTDPAAITANLGAVDSAFDSAVYRSFTVATQGLDPAASAAPQAAAALLGGTLPLLNRQAASPYLLSARRAQQLRALGPQMSLAAAQGRIIPDSVYGRVFQWDTTFNTYTWQDSVVTGLNGVRFILYQVDDFGSVVEPVVEVGTLDLIDESTLSTLQLHILVKGTGGTPTYVDYTASVTATATTVQAVAEGSLSNGLAAGANKTLTFDETFNVTQTGASVSATFTLNNPALTFTLSESVTFDSETIVIAATFRVVQPGETISFSARITLYGLDSATVHATVSANGHPVASIDGNADTAQWVDAGGEPLTADDLAALEGLDDAAARFQEAVNSLFLPIGTFFGG
jgi:hypothetical protein